MTQSRIANKIKWLAENFDRVYPQTLTGDLKGFYKLRIGDYRVLYEFSVEDKTIYIDRIEHRREIYR